MAKFSRKKRMTLAAITLASVLSCVAVSATMTKYFSGVERSVTMQPARFIVSTSSDAEKYLQIEPTQEGAFSSYEFWVSNADETDVSEVNQGYSVGLLIPTETLLSLSNISVSIQPMLIYTNDMDSTVDELYQNFISDSFAEGTTFVMADNFNVIMEAGDADLSEEELLQKYEYIPCTWFDQSNENAPVFFSFEAGKRTVNRHFIVFFVQGTLEANVSYDFTGLQVVVYSEQLE